DPAYGELGAEPREGVYLTVVNGCPKYRMGDCPVWKMTARVDPPITRPEPTEAPTPSPTPGPSTGVVLGADGYPVQIDGEPVYSGTSIGDHIAVTSDDTPFLILGTLRYAGPADCYIPPDYPTTPLLPPCGKIGRASCRES